MKISVYSHSLAESQNQPMADKTSRTRRKELRLPLQERSAMRMIKVLEAAERMLEEVGPEKTSIPALAEKAGVPRAAIYPFFPDKYALFSHLARLHMERLSNALALSEAENATTWQNWVKEAVTCAAGYYNAHPVASVLLLRETFTDDDRDAHAVKNQTIGLALRTKALSLGQLEKLPKNPDAAAIAVELAFACMKYGYLHESKISTVICEEATHAVIAYLMRWQSAT